jgi:hypothetical protein
MIIFSLLTMDPFKSNVELGNFLTHNSLPTFWHTNPRLCFAQVEAILDVHNTRSQKTTYSYVVQALPTEIAEELFELILHRPDHD